MSKQIGWITLRTLTAQLIVFAPLLLLSWGTQAAEAEAETDGCLKEKTQVVCLNERLLASGAGKSLPNDSLVVGLSSAYTLSVPSDQWVHMWPGLERPEDLLLVHSSGQAFVQVDWLGGQMVPYDLAALEQVEKMALKLDAEPVPIPVDVWPYQEQGAIYELCYFTDKDTRECMYSAVALMPGGTVRFLAMTALEEALMVEVLKLILSIDIVVVEADDTSSVPAPVPVPAQEQQVTPPAP